MHYDTIGKRFHMTADLTALANRDKVNLFHELGQQLGVYEAISKSTHGKEIEKLISEVLGKHW